MPDYDPLLTISALNMAVVSLHRITSSGDRLILDREYDSIINNLRMSEINADPELTELYQEIMRVIQSGRLRDEIRAEVESGYSVRKQRSIREIIRGNVLKSFSANPLRWLMELAVSSASEYFSEQIRPQSGEDSLTLKREELGEYDSLQRKLLGSSWTLLRQYHVPGKYMLTQNALVKFSAAMNEQDPSKRHRMMKYLEGDFAMYAPYWFYRARSAYDAGNDSRAAEYFGTFGEVWRPVLRKDPYKAEALKYRIGALVREGIKAGSAGEILGCLAEIRENSEIDDWANNIYMAMAYFTLGQREKAEDCVMCNIDFGFETEISGRLLAHFEEDNTLMFAVDTQPLPVAEPGKDALPADKKPPLPETPPKADTPPKTNTQDLTEDDDPDDEEEDDYPDDKEGRGGKFLFFLAVTVITILALLAVIHNSPKEDAPQIPPSTNDSLLTRAENGDSESQYKLGNEYRYGTDREQDYEAAVKWLTRAAENGHAEAQFSLGYMYSNGEGVPQDDTEAVKWYGKAAEQGHAAAQCNLGFMYEFGRGVTQDYTQAVYWYRKSADQGLARGQCNLGYMYESGKGTRKDYTEAAYWYRKSAEQEYARGQNNLGTMYYYGWGVTQDYGQAVYWYKKSAEQGYDRGQCNLGIMYDNGQGVPQDYTEALRLYRLSAEQGDSNGQYNLGVMYKDGKGTGQDDEEAARWFRKAADQGHARAQNKLGDMYLYGEGVEQDTDEAVRLYQLAARQGNTDAQESLEALGETW
ncbi:MAG: SEL1-like repeat protein [Synergistaceae bacterium]|nr:SEL1-like repeat protein [Synergistaceae bacterium]